MLLCTSICKLWPVAQRRQVNKKIYYLQSASIHHYSLNIIIYIGHFTIYVTSTYPKYSIGAPDPLTGIFSLLCLCLLRLLPAFSPRAEQLIFIDHCGEYLYSQLTQPSRGRQGRPGKGRTTIAV